VEAGSQANERVEKGEVRVLDEEGILVKTGGQENDIFCSPKSYCSNSICQGHVHTCIRQAKYYDFSLVCPLIPPTGG
jgi:hypothetical protein